MDALYHARIKGGCIPPIGVTNDTMRLARGSREMAERVDNKSSIPPIVWENGPFMSWYSKDGTAEPGSRPDQAHLSRVASLGA